MCYTESLELELIHEKKGGAQMKTPVFAASRINWLKIGKIAVGAAAAMALAGAAGLQNAMSAGLIVNLDKPIFFYPFFTSKYNCTISRHRSTSDPPNSFNLL